MNFDLYTDPPKSNDFLSHYSSLEVIKSILINKEFRCTDIYHMNDSLEVTWFDHIVDGIIENKLSKKKKTVRY